MADLTQVKHHPAIEELVDVVCKRTQNMDRPFFRVTVAYYLSVVAATMRATLQTEDRGEVPVSNYVISLAESGAGKGYSNNLLEHGFFKDFQATFEDYTLPLLAETNMWKMATREAAIAGTEEQHEFDKLNKSYDDLGPYLFSFDGGYMQSVKDIRQKLLIADAGALNLVVDEIGLNLTSAMVADSMTGFLELYDQGRIKNKITKHGSDKKRLKHLPGKTPANMLLMGTPEKLLDGAQTEKSFMDFLGTGYARRSWFAYGNPLPASEQRTAEEIYDDLVATQTDPSALKWAHHFSTLADPTKHNWTIQVGRDVGIELVKYKIQCERRAQEMPMHDSTARAEMSHRYFKTLRLAGALAFVDEVVTMDMYHLHAAMKLAEESGKAFQKLMNQEQPYEKLAKYIAHVSEERPVTHADLASTLPFYPKSAGPRTDMLTMATAYGYKKHIVIKKTYVDDVELFSGETLKETSLDSVQIAYSDHYAYHYQAENVPFDKLHILTQMKDYHWTNHGFTNEHRAEENVIPGCNLVVLDVDGGVPLSTVHDLLKGYVFMTYTTKRHTPEENRFRLIMPISYEMKLDKTDYREFMQNIRNWLPFPTDPASEQRSKKWMSYDQGSYHYNLEGDLLDVLPFVPRTTKNEQHQKKAEALKSLDNLERWFAQRFAEGDRNNQMIKFALALVDNRMSYNEIEAKVRSFNAKVSNGLSDDELQQTVLVTVAKKLQAQP